MNKIDIKPSETLYRRVVELGDYVFALSILKYPVDTLSFYYTMRIFQLKKSDDFREQLEAESITHEKSVFGRSSRKMPDLSEMIDRLETWFSSEFVQYALDFDQD